MSETAKTEMMYRGKEAEKECQEGEMKEHVIHKQFSLKLLFLN